MPAALSAESWEIVFQQTLAFAEYQVARLRWRHQFHGLLPGGFDPNSIAAQAIMDFLRSSVPPEVCPPTRAGARAGLDPILWQGWYPARRTLPGCMIRTANWSVHLIFFPRRMSSLTKR